MTKKSIKTDKKLAKLIYKSIKKTSSKKRPSQERIEAMIGYIDGLRNDLVVILDSMQTKTAEEKQAAAVAVEELAKEISDLRTEAPAEPCQCAQSGEEAVAVQQEVAEQAQESCPCAAEAPAPQEEEQLVPACECAQAVAPAEDQVVEKDDDEDQQAEADEGVGIVLQPIVKQVVIKPAKKGKSRKGKGRKGKCRKNRKGK